MDIEANATYEPWRDEPEGLRKEFRFVNFAQALAFTVEVARLAEAANHHPDLDLRYNKVLLNLVTHDAGGVTEKDRNLASEIDQIPVSALTERSRSLFS
jgi:4a-hydroxytetrahydrobiopterin dehydratase